MHETEVKDDFIIPQSETVSAITEPVSYEEPAVDSDSKDPDFDLSDIAVKTEDDMDREEIIAAAEAAAFSENN